MSPKNKKKLEIIRSKLDKLDNKLLSLIKYRTNLVKEVLKLKEFKKEIVDKKRINFILKKINLKSRKLKLNFQQKNTILILESMKCLWKKSFHHIVSNYFFLKFLFS